MNLSGQIAPAMGGTESHFFSKLSAAATTAKSGSTDATYDAFRPRLAIEAVAEKELLEGNDLCLPRYKALPREPKNVAARARWRLPTEPGAAACSRSIFATSMHHFFFRSEDFL